MSSVKRNGRLPLLALLLAAALAGGATGARAAENWGPPVQRFKPPHRAVQTQIDSSTLRFNADAGPACELTVASNQLLPDGDWELDFSLASQSPGSRIWVELSGEHPNERYRVGLTGQPSFDQWVNGRWEELWSPPPDSPQEPRASFHLLRFGTLGFLEVGEKGDLVTTIEMPNPRRVQVVTEGGDGHPLQAELSGWHVQAVTAQASSEPPRQEPLHKEAYVSYPCWMSPTGVTSLYGERAVDFPMIQLDNPYRRQVELMAKYGWTAIEVDFLFFKPINVTRQYLAMRRFMDAVAESGLKDFHVVAFLEIRDPQVTADGLCYILNRLGNRPEWGKQRGRPVIFTYPSRIAPTPAFWKQIMGEVRRAGFDPFWMFNLNNLRALTTGTFDKAEFEPYMSLFDGVYSFSASGLLAATKIPANARAAYGAAHPNLAFGATVWPGYLSCRPTQRNFNSPRGTAFLRDVWTAVLQNQPAADFVRFSTWNDYAESTTLSSSYSELTSRLEISQRYLCRYFDRPLPQGQANHPESVLSYRKCIYQGEPIDLEFLPLPTQSGPHEGKWHLELLDEQNRRIAAADSPTVPLDQMTPWKWEFPQGIQRAQTRLVRVRVSLTPENAPTIQYANLPDIAVAVPVSYADQLYYSIPLHKLAGADRGIQVLINGDPVAAISAGLDRISYKVSGAAGRDVQVAAMRDAHMMRLLSPLNEGGAEFVPDNRSGGANLRPLKPGESADWICRSPTETDGQDYFAALARFSDGAWAYSPTVWTVPPANPDQIAAMWIFAPNAPDTTKIIDRSIGHHDLELPSAKDTQQAGLKFVHLPNNGRALSFDGHFALAAPVSILPNGPVTLELLFRPRQVNREQTLVMQRGAQATLLIDAKGYLVARRLPEIRTYPNPFVELRSLHPLRPGQFYDAVVTFDGRELTLWLNGRKMDAKPCRGTRSTEGFFIGGPMSSNAASQEIDKLPPDSFFRGDMVRLSLFGIALNDGHIAELASQAREMPFWKD